MPRLSLDAKLRRQLAESIDSTRYTDLAIVARRLILTHHVPADTTLTDATGRKWIAGEVCDKDQPVRSVELWASTRAADGTALTWSGGVTALKATVIVSCGGSWDLLTRSWRRNAAGERMPAKDPVVVDLQESQIDAATWYQDRLNAFRNKADHPHVAGLLFDDRRGGKTFIAGFMLLGTLIDVPVIDEMPMEAWLVTQSLAARDEIEAEIEKLARPGWFAKREAPKRQFIFCHGAKLSMKTTDDVESLRVGRCDWALLNEAALLPEAAWVIVSRATQDKQGVVTMTTNSPRSISNVQRRLRGGWVARMWEAAEAEAAAGIEPAVRLLRCSPLKNTAISQKAKSKIMRAQAYARDPDAPDLTDEGLVAEGGDQAYSPPFDPEDHVRPLPQVGLVDVSAELLKRLHGRPYSYIVGADFQQQNAAVAFRIYAPRLDDPASWKNFSMWAVRGWFLKGGGDEHDLIDLMEGEGFCADNCLVVGDSSGQWQKGDHGYGPVSFDIFKTRGWDIVAPTKKKGAKGLYSKNPDVEQSVGQLRNAIKAGRFMVAPGEAAANVAKALHKCDATVDRLGNLRPKGLFAHIGDACRYPLFFLSTRVNAVAAPLPAYVRGR